ncbi:MAG: heat shock protein HspQ [Candidatus Omnitrophica bacterium]|nr:heat shock protein HspQ [Candidatus Omnitrophota bacterium]
MNGKKVSNFKFEVGQIIFHKRYKYRGVIFDRDPACKADESWYQKNQTQPDRKQPWYHVLVHDAAHTTYVAESNLEPDDTGEPVRHPILPRIFKSFVNNRYYHQSMN